MTAPDPTPDALPEEQAAKALTTFTWGYMLGTAIFEVALLSQVANFPSGAMDRVSLYAAWISIELLWLWFLLLERLNRYDRRRARANRISGLASQVALLAFQAFPRPNWFPQFIIAFWFAVMAAIAWHAWMRTAWLHPEDQAVIDEIREEENRRLFGDLRARQLAIRQAKLQEAIAYVRRTSNSPTPALAPTPQQQSINWQITRGRHQPLVYFIRNGNRIKIGTTTDLYQRIRRLALRPEHVALVIPGGRTEERALHRRFADLRDGNTEWFQDAGPLTQYLADQIAAAIKKGD